MVGGISAFNGYPKKSNDKFRFIFDTRDTIKALEIILSGLYAFVQNNDNCGIYGKLYTHYQDEQMQCGKIVNFIFDTDITLKKFFDDNYPTNILNKLYDSGV